MIRWAIFTIALVVAACGDTGCTYEEIKTREFVNGSYKYTTCIEETCPGSTTRYRTCRTS